MRIGVVGGTGPAGQGVALRLASVGIDVIMGSRSYDRALGICTKLCEQWVERDLSLIAGDNGAAASADLVVLATPWEAAAPTAGGLADRLRGKVVISMANALIRVGTEFVPLIPPRGSVAAWVQATVPEALVAAALHHVPARELADLSHPLGADVLVCSDRDEAAKATIELINTMPGLRGLDAGRLANATAIEALTPVLLQLNVRYQTRASIRLTNIETR